MSMRVNNSGYVNRNEPQTAEVALSHSDGKVNKVL